MIIVTMKPVKMVQSSTPHVWRLMMEGFLEVPRSKFTKNWSKTIEQQIACTLHCFRLLASLSTI
jgi:hypothetical protein